MSSLLDRIRTAAADPQRATQLGRGIRDRRGRPVPYVARRPVKRPALQRAEARLGFALPSFLATLYLEIGNGGFGPGYGLLPVSVDSLAPDEDADEAMVELFEQLRANHEPDETPWPDGLLPLVLWGSGEFSCLDLEPLAANGQIVRYHPGLDDEVTSELVPPDVYRGAGMLPEADSFPSWIEAWLNGEELSRRPYHWPK